MTCPIPILFDAGPFISAVIALLNNNSASTASNSSAALTTIAAAPKNSLVVVGLSAVGGGNISTFVDSAGNNYVKAVQENPGAGEIEIWYCKNLPASLPVGGSFKATTILGGNWTISGAAYAIGFNGGLDKTGTYNVTALTASISSGELSAANEVIFVANVQNTPTAYTEGSGFTELSGNPQTNAQGSDFAYHISTSRLSVTWAPSWTPSQTSTGALATFQVG